MTSLQLQGIVVAACLIGCAIFAIALCIKVLPDPAQELTPLERFDQKKRNNAVLGWIVLACVGVVAGHLIAYYTLGAK